MLRFPVAYLEGSLMPDEMTLAHGRDYTAHAAMDNAISALRALQDESVHNKRLGAVDLEIIEDLCGRLRSHAAQIVRAWD